MSIWVSYLSFGPAGIGGCPSEPYLEYADEDGCTPEDLTELPRGGLLDIAASHAAPGLYRVLVVQDGVVGSRVYVDREQLTQLRDTLTAMLDQDPPE